MSIDLICTSCGGPLLATEEALLSCNSCNRQYPVDGGVVRLLEQNDEFYEGAYENQVRFIPRSERPWHVWPLWLINSGYLWAVRRNVPAGSTVVELGCAGGVRYFGTRYRMIGCDLSIASLRKLDGAYDARLQADATHGLPLPDESVDAVVSSYFWEHIPPEIKPHVLAELNRILRPGGKLVFLYDVETQNPLIRHYKEIDRALYDRLFLEGDGHVGYQRHREHVALFEEAGFRVVRHQGMEKSWILSPSAYTKLAQFGGGKRSRLWEMASGLGCQPLFYIYTALIRTVDTLVCPWLPRDWARIDLTVSEKVPRESLKAWK